MNKEGKEEEDGDRIYKEVWKKKDGAREASKVGIATPFRSSPPARLFVLRSIFHDFSLQCAVPSREEEYRIYVVNETRQSRLSSRLVKKTR